MIGKNTIKRIAALQQKKFRWEQELFVAEGERLVDDILNSGIEVESLFFTSRWKQDVTKKTFDMVEVSELEMKRMSSLTTSTPVLAVVKMPKYNLNPEDLTNKLTIALDDIQDPGNLGTIIRLADWFGVKNVVCSTNTVDVYSPKVVQATMGAIARVKVHYVDLNSFLEQVSAAGIMVYGTFMAGQNIYTTKLTNSGVVVMGNEGNGISSEIEKLVSQRLTIPNFSSDESTSESLNVAMATAVVCSEFCRRTI